MHVLFSILLVMALLRLFDQWGAPSPAKSAHAPPVPELEPAPQRPIFRGTPRRAFTYRDSDFEAWRKARGK